MQENETNDQIQNSKEEDSGAKLIFENATLCAQLLRDYSGIELLENVQAEDITDVTERYIPMFTEERNADVVKKVRVNDGEEIFIALIEHKSSVDYNVGMQILRYMVYIWEDYERREERRVPGISKLMGFKYPPIFPIVYYNGEGKWTADKALKSRVALSDIFSHYIPDYEYHLVNTADHGNDELVKKNDGLSLLIILNKIRDTEEFSSLDLPKDYLDNLSANAPEDVLDVLARVVAVLLRKHHVSEDEVQDFVSQIKERHMSDLFANFKATVNVQEERRIGREQGKEIGKEIGRGIGEEIKLIKQVCGKMQKGWDAEKISELFEEDFEHIQKIYDVALKHSPDFNADKIYEELHSSEIKEEIAEELVRT